MSWWAPSGVGVGVCGLRAVDPTQVDHQLVVDIHPDVVVAPEGEHLTTLIGEPGVDLVGEPIVVAVSLVTEKLAVDREKGPVVETVDRRVVPDLGQVDIEVSGQIHPFDVPIPLVEQLDAACRSG